MGCCQSKVSSRHDELPSSDSKGLIVRIKILGALNLKSSFGVQLGETIKSRLESTRDPYVRISCTGSSQVQVTSTRIHKSQHPTWHEEFFFCLDRYDPVLTLEVMDKELVGGDLDIGRAVVPLHGLISRKGEKEVWVPITDPCSRDAHKMVTGELGFTVTECYRMHVTPNQAKRISPIHDRRESGLFCTARMGQQPLLSTKSVKSIDPKWDGENGARQVFYIPYGETSQITLTVFSEHLPSNLARGYHHLRLRGEPDKTLYQDEAAGYRRRLPLIFATPYDDPDDKEKGLGLLSDVKTKEVIPGEFQLEVTLREDTVIEGVAPCPEVTEDVKKHWPPSKPQALRFVASIEKLINLPNSVNPEATAENSVRSVRLEYGTKELDNLIVYHSSGQHSLEQNLVCDQDFKFGMQAPLLEADKEQMRKSKLTPFSETEAYAQLRVTASELTKGEEEPSDLGLGSISLIDVLKPGLEVKADCDLFPPVLSKSKQPAKAKFAFKVYHTIIVRIHSCKVNVQMDSNGLADPYLVLKLGDTTHMSRIVLEDRAPHYNDVFRFPIAAGSTKDEVASLDLELVDADFIVMEKAMMPDRIGKGSYNNIDQLKARQTERAIIEIRKDAENANDPIRATVELEITSDLCPLSNTLAVHSARYGFVADWDGSLEQPDPPAILPSGGTPPQTPPAASTTTAGGGTTPPAPSTPKSGGGQDVKSSQQAEDGDFEQLLDPIEDLFGMKPWTGLTGNGTKHEFSLDDTMPPTWIDCTSKIRKMVKKDKSDNDRLLIDPKGNPSFLRDLLWKESPEPPIKDPASGKDLIPTPAKFSPKLLKPAADSQGTAGNNTTVSATTPTTSRTPTTTPQPQSHTDPNASFAVAKGPSSPPNPWDTSEQVPEKFGRKLLQVRYTIGADKHVRSAYIYESGEGALSPLLIDTSKRPKSSASSVFSNRINFSVDVAQEEYERAEIAYKNAASTRGLLQQQEEELQALMDKIKDIEAGAGMAAAAKKKAEEDRKKEEEEAAALQKKQEEEAAELKKRLETLSAQDQAEKEKLEKLQEENRKAQAARLLQEKMSADRRKQADKKALQEQEDLERKKEKLAEMERKRQEAEAKLKEQEEEAKKKASGLSTLMYPDYWTKGLQMDGKLHKRDITDDPVWQARFQTLLDENCRRGTLGAGHDQVTKVKGKKYDRLVLHKAYRLENLKLYSIYAAHRDLELDVPKEQVDVKTHSLSTSSWMTDPVECGLRKEDRNEVYLWHGTKPDCVDLIAGGGFDERFSKLSGLFGAGVYLADEVSKSDQYCTPTPENDPQNGVYHIFLVRATLGTYGEVIGKGTPDARRPPNGCTSLKGQLDPKRNTYFEYVLYDGWLAYPEFLLEYKRDYK